MGRLNVLREKPGILLNVAGGGAGVLVFFPYYNSRYDPIRGPPPLNRSAISTILSEEGGPPAGGLIGPPHFFNQNHFKRRTEGGRSTMAKCRPPLFLEEFVGPSIFIGCIENTETST